MPRFNPTEFGRLLARLTSQELRQVEGLVAMPTTVALLLGLERPCRPLQDDHVVHELEP